MINVEECINKGLLRKIPASREKARLSLQKASELLEEAKKNLEDERFNSAVLVCYMALFNAARALLFKDGFREKSHECIIQFLYEKYAATKKLPKEMIDLLEKFKSERNLTQYDVSYTPNEEEIEEMVKFAGEFIQEIEGLVG